MKSLIRRVVLVTLCGVVLYGLFAIYTGVSRMGAELARFDFAALVLALGLSTLNYSVRFFKWQFYLARLQVRGIPAIDSFLVFLSGFILTVTPGKVGEVFKSAVLVQTHGVPLERTAPIVIAERLTDALGVVVLILLGSAAFPGGLGWALAGGATVLLALLLASWPPPLDWCCDRLERTSGRAARVAPRLRAALVSLRTVAGPSALLWPTLLSILGWGCEGVALFVLLQGFSVAVPLGLSVFFYATATLAGALVPLPGGLGIVEGLLHQQLVELGGVPEAPATAAMILIRLTTLWWAVLVGFAALFALRLRFPKALRGGSEPSAVGARIG